MNLGTGETQIVTPLLSKDYPNNFVEAAKKLNDPNNEPFQTQFEIKEKVRELIGNPNWLK